MKTVIIILITCLFCLSVEAKKKKVQEVNFEGADVRGTIRNPDGTFIVQKRGIEFVPLYRVRENFSNSVKDSIEYLR